MRPRRKAVPCQYGADAARLAAVCRDFLDAVQEIIGETRLCIVHLTRLVKRGRQEVRQSELDQSVQDALPIATPRRYGHLLCRYG